METLTFEPAPFRGTSPGGCGCDACKHGELDERDDELDAFDDELEAKIDRKHCGSDVPSEVYECIRKHPKAKRKLCHPDFEDWCPEIPMLWRSHTIAGVPFYYGAKVAKVPGTDGKRYQVVKAKRKDYEVRLVPRSWNAAHKWITLMSGMGMPLEAVLTAGAGPYCRCVKRPRGCGEDNPGICTGKTRSNHGAGDAIDVTGVIWKSPSSVGSSLRATVMHSWTDSAEQAPILVRINAALRLAFPKVIDYADPFHRDHFHVDTNQGKPVPLFEGTEKSFVVGCLRRAGYLTSKRTDEDEIKRGLAAFAARLDIQVPSGRDLEAWRPLVHRLYGCVAIGNPACRRV